MFKPISLLAVLAISLLFGCATQTPTSSSGKVFDSPIGEWTELYEQSGGHEIPVGGQGASTGTLKQTIIDETRGISSNNQRVEFYEIDDQGRWKGYWISDQALTKYYICDEKKSGSSFWGEITYQFNEAYNQYTGTWDRCGEGKKFWVKGFR